MHIDKFVKVCLVFIILLLIANLFKPLFTSIPAYAQKTNKIEYKVVDLSEADEQPVRGSIAKLEAFLNKYGAEGWRYVGLFQGEYPIFSR